MFSNKKSWFGFNSKPRNPHSLDQLKYLYNVMSKNQTVTEQNRTLLVETLRSISEILIWGDQNDSSVFDFFLEKNMLSFFLRIMKQKCGSYVCVQLLQTLNILFENIRNETSLYYLLSNNHVNSIIVHKFDFSDEEVMAYYISFLKTLSFKLNTHTIHFFFNEHTNDFPLYTEAIKFFNHSEKMVRIAVRTLTLNVFRVEEISMLKFITDRTAVPYFSNLVWFIGNHVLEIDNCLHSSPQTQQTVVKLDDLVAEHLDHLHYLNDILLLQIADLNAVLTEHLLNRLLVPLYIFSLIEPKSAIRSGDEPCDKKIRISRLVSLFLLSQVFLIVSFKPLVCDLLNIVQNGNLSVFRNPEFTAPTETLEESLFQVSNSSPNSSRCENDEEQVYPSDVSNMTEEDGESSNPVIGESSDGSEEPMNTSSEPDTRPITDEEKAAAANPNLVTRWSQRLTDRPFLDALFQCMQCNQTSDDHTFIFALCLIYAMVHNKENEGLNQSNLGDLVIVSPMDSSPEQESSTCNKLISHLIQIMHLCSQYNSRIRLVTLEMSVMLLKKLVMHDGRSLLSDHMLASVEQAKEEAASILRNFFKNEEEAIFLDLFEEELTEMRRKKLNVEYLMMDANLLLPPNQLTSLMMNGVDFTRRLPCADVERTRYAIRVFFLLRDLSLVLRGEEETQLPLTHGEAVVRIDQLLDLNNGDLIACTVVTKDSGKIRRFMVIDARQLILIEPDNRKLGFGVAKFVALLQDVEVTADGDSRSLNITIRDRAVADNRQKRVALAAKFIFDDHIRCLAAKQRLTKGRIKARQRKMHQIAKLIELGTHTYNPRRLKSHLMTKDLPRSHSQEGFHRKSHHLHHNAAGAVEHKPRTSIPGLAVPDNHTSGSGGSGASGSRIKSSHQLKRNSAASITKQLSSSRDGSPSHRRSSSSVDTDSNVREAPISSTGVMSNDMIPLEDMSPKPERRSRSRTRTDKLTASETSEAV